MTQDCLATCSNFFHCICLTLRLCSLPLQEVSDARKIRNRILANFELATQPGVSRDEQERLLHLVIVGGGPTGVEFGAEFYDFLKQVRMSNDMHNYVLRHTELMVYLSVYIDSLSEAWNLLKISSIGCVQAVSK